MNDMNRITRMFCDMLIVLAFVGLADRFGSPFIVLLALLFV